MQKKYTLIFLILFLLFSACTDFEYSPNQAFDKDSPVNLNQKNLSKLNLTAIDDTIRFVVLGDPQKSSNELDRFIEKANEIHQSKKIDFVFMAGDLAEFGLLQETEWVANRLMDLKMPSFGVIGNHDLLANGETAFKRMFGPLNYSFTYSGVKFICHNTNGREYKFNGTVPDINWLKNELNGGANVNAYIGVSHVRPFTSDFDSKLDTIYSDNFNNNPKSLASFHAHDHEFGEYYPNNSRIPYIVTTNIGQRGFILAQIVNNQLSYEQVEF